MGESSIIASSKYDQKTRSPFIFFTCIVGMLLFLSLMVLSTPPSVAVVDSDNDDLMVSSTPSVELKEPSVETASKNQFIAPFPPRVYAIGTEDNSLLQSWPGPDLPWSVESNPLPGKILRGKMIVLNSYIHVVGGSNTRTIYRWDISQRQWQVVGDLIAARTDAALTIYNDTIVVTGGTFKMPTPYDQDSIMATNTVEAVNSTFFDMNQTSYYSVSFSEHMNYARAGHTLENLNGAMYAIGGYTNRPNENQVNNYTVVSTVERFSALARAWVISTPMRTPRAYHASSIFENNIVVCGGTTSVTYNDPLNSCEIFDGQSSWFNFEPLRSPRFAFSMLYFQGKLYAFGGSTEYEMDSSDVEVFDTVWSSQPSYQLLYPISLSSALVWPAEHASTSTTGSKGH